MKLMFIGFSILILCCPCGKQFSVMTVILLYSTTLPGPGGLMLTRCDMAFVLPWQLIFNSALISQIKHLMQSCQSVEQLAKSYNRGKKVKVKA